MAKDARPALTRQPCWCDRYKAAGGGECEPCQIRARDAEIAVLRAHLEQARIAIGSDALAIGDVFSTIEAVASGEPPLVKLAELPVVRAVRQLRVDKVAAEAALVRLREQLQELVDAERAELKRVDAIAPTDYWYPSLQVFGFLEKLAALLAPSEQL